MCGNEFWIRGGYLGFNCLPVFAASGTRMWIHKYVARGLG